ncbi:HIT domain-containing protein [Patescibacteria group bacterium]|nr:HIT domain-containing protein [Patescibacteria group bacterium]
MENCIFCKIVAGDIPSTKTYEDEDFIAFLDIHPKAPGHTLVVPKAHFAWFLDLPDELSDKFFRVARTISAQLKNETSADYIHLSIVGKDVPHAHIHLIPQNL